MDMAQMNNKPGFDHVGVVVCALVHDGNDNMLLLKRGAKARDEHGKWDICGGALDFGESVKAGLERELMEELCTEAVEVKFLSAIEVIREQEGKKTHWIALLHAVRVDPLAVKLGEPHKFDEIGWFTLGSLPSPLHSQFPKVLKVAKKAKILN